MTKEEYSEVHLSSPRNFSFPMTEDEFELQLIRIQEERTTQRRFLLSAKDAKKKAEFCLEELDRIEEKLRSGYKEQLDKDD